MPAGAVTTGTPRTTDTRQRDVGGRPVIAENMRGVARGQGDARRSWEDGLDEGDAAGLELDAVKSLVIVTWTLLFAATVTPAMSAPAGL